ncbi:MAG: hypothetical protein E7552_00715 [Ruminococcaceae bacterium]|nr:hypothetical protein [Oscillospiraceae bacterium]
MASKRDLTIKKRRVAAKEEPMPEKVSAEPKAPRRKPQRRSRRYGRSVIWPLLFRLTLLVAVVMLGVLLWRNWDDLAPAALTEWFDRTVTGGDGGDGYPVDISGDSVVSMQTFGNNAALLTDTSLLVYNSSGAQTINRGHTFADPLLRTAGEYMLVAELGGNRYILHTKKEEVLSGQTQGAIVSAAVSSNGQIALVTESSQSYMSEVLVFNRKGNKMFHWYSADLMVADVAFSPRQKEIAVLGLSAAEGDMRSTLHIFSLSGKEEGPTHTYRNTGAMMAAVQYFDNGRVAAVGDTAVWVYDPDKNEAAVTEFADAELLGFAFGNDGIGAVTRDYGESRGGMLRVFTSVGNPVREIAFAGDYRHVTAAGRGFYLLTEDTLYQADDAGIAKQTTVSADSLMTVEMNAKPLILRLSMLTRCTWDEG